MRDFGFLMKVRRGPGTFLEPLKCVFLIFLILFPFGFTLMPASAGKSHQLMGAFFDPEYGHYRKWNMSGLKPPLSWASNFLPSTYETRDPARALYDSSDVRVILWQLGKMKQAGLDFVAAYWQGRGSYSDRVLRKILFEVMPRQDNSNHELRWTIEYEAERFSNPSVEELVRDMQYLKTVMAASSSLLRIHDRIVVFVRGGGDDGVPYVRRWSEVADRVGGLYVILKVFPGSSAVADAVDGWYEFAPANRIQFDSYYWGYVSPGFSMFNDSTRRLSRNLNEFAVALERVRESNAHFALIETWNDWCEGTQIEPGVDRASGEGYGDGYVNMVRQVMKDNLHPISHQLPAILGAVLVTVIITFLLLPTGFCRMKSRSLKRVGRPASERHGTPSGYALLA